MNNKSLFIVELVLILLIGVSSFFFLMVPSGAKRIVDIQLVLYILLLLANYRRNKSFNLYQIWIAAYVFIVWSEMEIIASNSFSDSYIIPFTRFTLANFSFLFGYHVLQKNTFHANKANSSLIGSALFVLLLIGLYVYYIASKYTDTRSVYFSGRSYGSGSALGGGSLLNSLTGSVGLLLPALIGYYIIYVKRKKAWVGLLLSLPIFVILLLTTSRFKFLFSVLPFLIITGVFNLKSTSIRKNLMLLISLIVILAITSFIKKNRNVAFNEVDTSEIFNYQERGGEGLFEKTAYQMSPEGVVYMASIADDYFSTHKLHYGKETGFILYFWVPRGWWPNKPTMLDNWLIREYNKDVAEGFSTASGFIGELRADFGWLCLFFIFLFGMFVRRLDNYTSFIVNNYPKSFHIVLISILFPWIFFFVRSPLTATMTLLWELVIWIVIARTMSNNNVKS